jgi:hypothetical protein
MKKTFTLSVPQPCYEKWEQFNPTTLGGFCSSCQKEVVDFTSWDEDAIKSYFKNRDVKTCGRFLTTQLKDYTLTQSNSRSIQWKPLSLLSLTLIFSNHAGAQKERTSIHKMMASNNPISSEDTTRVMIVQGIVKSSFDQTPLPGVTIYLKRSAEATLTDENGKFSLSVSNPSPTDSVVFSLTGLETETRSIYESDTLSVFIKEDFTMLGMTVTCKREVRTVSFMVGAIDVHTPQRKFWQKLKGLFR